MVFNLLGAGQIAEACLGYNTGLEFQRMGSLRITVSDSGIYFNRLENFRNMPCSKYVINN